MSHLSFSELLSELKARKLSKLEKIELLETLKSVLTINESASLTAKINEMNFSGQGKGKRFSLFPIEDYGAYERMLRMDASHWDSSEVKFNEDRNDFNELTPEEQEALLICFSFFAVGDGTVSAMLAYQLIVCAENYESQAVYCAQLNIERMHAITYANMIQSLVQSVEQRNKIFNAVDNVPAIKALNQFIEDAYTFPDGKRHMYIALACAEYLMFSPLFSIIFHFRTYKPGKMKEVLFANELISKDECEHCINGCIKYNELHSKDKYSNSEIHQIIQNVVGLVSDLAKYMIVERKVNLTEITYESMVQYIQFVADDLLWRTNHTLLYNVTNPFSWMIFTQFDRKGNMYEGSLAEYKHFNVKDQMTYVKNLDNRFNNTSSNSQVNVKIIAKKNKF